MTTGTLTLACLLLAANALPPDVAPMNSRNFDIPIKIEKARQAEIRELVLYVSSDRGKVWQQNARVTPVTPAFRYYAPSDGEFWFIVGVVNQQGKQDPEDVYKALVSQKVFIDTVKPDLRIASADRVGDEVVVKWEARDDNLDPSTLKLEYRSADMQPGVWNPVTVNPSSPGQGSFRPASLAAVQVRVSVSDLAENTSTATADVAAAAGGAATTTTVSSIQPPPPPPAGGVESHEWNSSAVKPVSQRERIDTPPALLPSAAGQPLASNPAVQQPVVVSTQPQGNQVVAVARGQHVTPDSVPSPALPPPAMPAPPPAPRAAGPPVQIIKDRQITLEYVVGNLGVSGVGSVEVFATRDGGLSWQTSGGSQNVNIPAMGDPLGTTAPERRTLKVDLPGEGEYGFYIVVKNGAGLGKQPPQSGTLPQIRVELDTTAPEAVLYKPEPVPGQRNVLLISWKAADRNLAAKPITLEWAESREGPWQTIGDREMPNDGHYSWHLPAGGIPPRVHLRLTVRDVAGNISVAQTDQPELIDLSEPEVVGVQLSHNPR